MSSSSSSSLLTSGEAGFTSLSVDPANIDTRPIKFHGSYIFISNMCATFMCIHMYMYGYLFIISNDDRYIFSSDSKYWYTYMYQIKYFRY